MAASCTLLNARIVDLILLGFGEGGEDLALDVAVVCSEAHGSFGDAVAARERLKRESYAAEVARVPMMRFEPFVVGSLGGFGPAARRVWKQFCALALRSGRSDWRHSWSSVSFSAVWRQKLSAAMANRSAAGALLRAPLLSRQQAFGSGLSFPLPLEEIGCPAEPDAPFPPQLPLAQASASRAGGVPIARLSVAELAAREAPD